MERVYSQSVASSDTNRAFFMLTDCTDSFQDNSFGGGMGKYKRDTDKIDTMNPIKDRTIRIKFNADAAGMLAWNFKPLQDVINVNFSFLLCLIWADPFAVLVDFVGASRRDGIGILHGDE